ncbi:MAG: hypothetical protein ACRCYS_11455 [Beijerinckiaceae bacterium]
MGKRSDFERVERDYYATPPDAVLPLIPHLSHGLRFIEPCAGNGALIDCLVGHGLVCAGALDIEPQRDDIPKGNALAASNCEGADVFITNPPWLRDTLHPLIVHLSDMLPTWLLFDADWIHTLQAAPFKERCRSVVSVGRVRWIAGSENDGKDNAAWYLFTKPSPEPTIFHWRAI